jgi:amidophosphoribosyltransferase
MSKLGDFIAFRAALRLHEKNGSLPLLDTLLEQCRALQQKGQLHTQNLVREIYKPFTPETLACEIAALITPADVSIPVEVIVQPIETLHRACPTNTGDWYFTGNYPTPGGNKVCNTAFMNFMEGKNIRGY